MRSRRFGSAARIVALVAVMGVFGAGQVLAQNLGKITGKITDSETGEPLPGSNVVIKGTTMGTAADAEGDYFILQVPPGEHELVASFIGYQTITIQEVEVRRDLTTRIDIKLPLQTIEGEEITIVADQGMVQADITFTRRNTSREQMENMPGIESTEDIFKLEAGAIVESVPQSITLDDGTQLQVRDESIKDVHIRGGQGGEILYMVDGMPVTHPIYGGRSVLELSVTDVDGIELLTGAFNAEYGQAQSGVVNISTRSGGEKQTAGARYKTDAFDYLGESYSSHYGTFYTGGPDPISREILPRLGINLPGEISYFVSGSLDMTDTRYNNQRRRGPFSILGVDLTEKQQNQANLNGKISYQITPRIEMILSYHGTWLQQSSFDWDWKDVPDNTAGYDRNNQSLNFQYRHTLSNSTFYALRLGYLGVDTHKSLNGMSPRDFWTITPDTIFTNIESPTRDPRTGFIDRGYENMWIDDLTHSYTGKLDVTSQIHSEHLVKTGAEFRYHDLQYVNILGGGLRLSDYGRHVFMGEPEAPRPEGPFPEFGQNRWVFFSQPMEGSFYIQDKFEQRGLIINAGVRIDGFTPGHSVMTEQFRSVWEDATGLEATWKRWNYKVSPRFGISFPISVNTVLFFSYGHFNQLPEIRYFYQEPYTGSFTGNPHLDYEQTILYEFGFTHQFTRNWALDIKSYNKDISGRIGSQRLLANRGLPVTIWDNKGYARARGMEFKLNKRYSNFTSGEINYTMQWATGYSSSAFDDYIRSQDDFPNPIRERRVGWDVRHQVMAQGMLRSPRRNPLTFFGLKLPSDWQLSLLSRLSSGQPYTPGTNDQVERQKLENTSEGPLRLNTDIKFRKHFAVAGTRIAFFAEVFNIFNQRNAQISYGFNNWTGEPYAFGDVVGSTSQLYNWWDMYYNMNPRQFTNGRRVQAGLQFDL